MGTSEHSKIGLIVPSSNTTMETEIPELLRRRAEASGGSEGFTFHSSRVRMSEVTARELERMVADSDRCVIELTDARVDVIAYACLIAVMAQGEGFHRTVEARLAGVAENAGVVTPVVSAAGSLVRGLQAMNARRVAIVAPYLKPLTRRVAAYLAADGIEVTDTVSLEISDNLEVGRHDPARLVELARGLDTSDADAVVLSACVQMPSLAAIEPAQEVLGLPVVSAATAIAFELLVTRGLEPVVPGAGHLLSGAVSARSLART